MEGFLALFLSLFEGRRDLEKGQSRGVYPPVQIRRVDGAQRKWCRKTSVYLSRETGMSGNVVGRKRLHFHFSLSCIGEGNGNPLQCSCLENPRDGGAWWGAVYGIAQSRTRLKQLSSSSSSTVIKTLSH